MHKTLKQVKLTKETLKKINQEMDLLPDSIKSELKVLELKLFVQSCNLENLIKEEVPNRHLKIVKAG